MGLQLTPYGVAIDIWGCNWHLYMGLQLTHYGVANLQLTHYGVAIDTLWGCNCHLIGLQFTPYWCFIYLFYFIHPPHAEASFVIWGEGWGAVAPKEKERKKKRSKKEKKERKKKEKEKRKKEKKKIGNYE